MGQNAGSRGQKCLPRFAIGSNIDLICAVQALHGQAALRHV